MIIDGKQKRLKPEEKQRAWDLYFNESMSSGKIASLLGVSGVAIRVTIKKMGGVLRGPVESHSDSGIKTNVFDVLTPESLYWIGFLLSDGYVLDSEGTSPRIGLTLKVEDKKHVEKFASFVCSKFTVNVKKSNNSAGFTVRSSKLAAALALHGIIPRKSRFCKPSDAVRFSHDFWRGMIDGDGHIKEANGCPNVSLIGSYQVGLYFCEYFNSLGIEYAPKIRYDKSTNQTCTVNLHGHGAQQLLNVLYPDDCLVSLERKQKIAFLLRDKYKNKCFRVLKENIHQSATFPYLYTNFLDAHSDFLKLKNIDWSTLISTTKKTVTDYTTYHISKSTVGRYASNHFHEPLRMTVPVGNTPSPFEAWKDPFIQEKIKEEALSRKHSSFRSSFLANVRPAWGFPPAVAKAIYQHFNCRRILDPCAGWGDRLTAALACDDVDEYVGVDPHKAVHDVYQKIISSFSDQKKKISLMEGCFEDCVLPENYFDISFTSPPYFNWERYSLDNNQSFLRYPLVEDWKNNFLRALIEKSAYALRTGGILAINISDVPDEKGSHFPLTMWTRQLGDACPALTFLSSWSMATSNFARQDEDVFIWRKN